MGSFNDAQIATIAQQLGTSPEQTIGLLQQDGHTYTPGGTSMGASGPLNIGLDQQLGAPPQAPQVMPQNAYTMGPQGTVGQPLTDKPAQFSRVADVSGVGASAPPPGPQPQAMIRARGPQPMPQQAPQGQGVGAGGGMGRIRGLFDQRQKQLAGELDAAASAYNDAANKLADVQGQAFGYQQQRLDAEAGYAGARAQAMDDIAKRQEQALALDQQARQKEQGILQAHQAEIDQRRDAYVNARVKGPSVGQRIGNAIAVALAGVGDAFMAGAGQQGNAMARTMNVVEGQIQRETDAQLEAIRRQGAGLDDAQRSLATLRQQFGDDASFRKYVMGTQYQVAATKLDAMAAGNQNETAKLQAQQASTLFKQQAAQLQAEGAAGALSGASERLRQAGDQRFNTELGLAVGERQAAQAAARKADPKQTPGVVGLQQIAPEVTSEDRKKAQEINAGTAGIRETVAQLEAMAAKGMTLDPTQRAVARRRIASLKSQFNGVFGDGTAPNEAQLQELDNLFANPTELNMQNSQQAFRTLRQDAETLTNAKLQGYGFAIGGGAGGSFREE